MSVAEQLNDQTDIKAIMAEIGRQARAAGLTLSMADTEQKNQALTVAAARFRARMNEILAANDKDMDYARNKGLSDAMLDRLLLTPERIEAMARGVEDIVALPDPVGSVMSEWDRPNGLKISRVRTALGVIGVIYESRPNVTADAGALCLKSGNASILRGGSESFYSSGLIHACLVEGLEAAGLPAAAIQRVPTRDRAAVGEMLNMVEHIDIIVPRGGKSLIARVQDGSRVPVIAHLEGLCHVYVDGDADLAMARDLVLNAKMRRTGICGSAETLLVDQRVKDSHLPAIITDLLDAGCEVRGDEAVQAVDSRVKPASEEDWSTEYLDSIISARLVSGPDEAIAHIARYGSNHTEAIVTDNAGTAEKFLNDVDSAIVMWNASTQFADGAEFGMGAEIGISTNRLHARGPVGLEQLTTFKYVVRGTGQTRP